MERKVEHVYDELGDKDDGAAREEIDLTKMPDQRALGDGRRLRFRDEIFQFLTPRRIREDAAHVVTHALRR
jgi:hypothetical protein